MHMAIDKTYTSENPFYKTVDIPDKYFCDRETETAKLISYTASGNDTVITAKRRIGKSSLLYHLFRQPEIKDKYNTLMVDINQTKCEADFLQRLSGALLKSSFAKAQKGRKKITEIIPELKVYAKVDFKVLSAGAETVIKNKYDLTLEKIFDFMEKTDRPNIVVFDEFQTIEDYPEKMSAILRTFIQKMKNTRFVFSGSEEHMLNSMFKDINKPFYKSALHMELRAIPEKTYCDYCSRMFAICGKSITEDAVKLVYNLFSGNTYDIQQVMNLVFIHTRKNKPADVELVKNTIIGVVYDNDFFYSSLLNTIKKDTEKNLLLAIASEGIAERLMSEEMINKYWLGSSSSVQNSIKKLSERNIDSLSKEQQGPIITKIGENSYRLNDRFFELWLADNLDLLESRFEEAAELHHKECSINRKPVEFKKPQKGPKKPPH